MAKRRDGGSLLVADDWSTLWRCDCGYGNAGRERCSFPSHRSWWSTPPRWPSCRSRQDGQAVSVNVTVEGQPGRMVALPRPGGLWIATVISDGNHRTLVDFDRMLASWRIL